MRFSEIRIHALHSNLSGGNLFMTHSYVLYIIPLSYRQCKFCLEVKTNCQQECGKQRAGLNSSLGDHTPWGPLTFFPQISGLRPGVAAKFAKENATPIPNQPWHKHLHKQWHRDSLVMNKVMKGQNNLTQTPDFSILKKCIKFHFIICLTLQEYYTHMVGTDFDIRKESGAKYFQKTFSVSIQIREKYTNACIQRDRS